MATRHKTFPLTEKNIDEALSERATMRQETGLENTHDNFGSYLANCRGGFVARFKRAQQALTSNDAKQVDQLGDEARQSEAEAIVTNYLR